MGKQPDVLIEFVSDRKGGEETFKKNLYARLGVPHSAVFDPKHLLSEETLRTYELVVGKYRPGDPGPWSDIGLGLRLWQGARLPRPRYCSWGTRFSAGQRPGLRLRDPFP